MKTNNNIPAYRFQGYTDAWELRKLGEVMEVTSVKRIHQSDWTDFGVRFLRARDIVAESKNESVSEPLFISQKKYDEYTAISGKVIKGDLLVTGVGTIGIPMLIEKNEPIYFKDGNIIWFKNENHIDGQFFYYSFIGKKIQSFIKESAGIGTVGTFTINTGKNTPIDLPVLKKEQEAIGTFFSTLDRHITLHQRKLDTLKEQKKTYLKLLFPAKGQTKPALRFQGFEDDWEEVKLGEVCTIQGGNAWKSDSYSLTGEYLVVTIANVTGEYFIDDKKGNRIDINPNEMQYVLNKGDILISLTGNVGRVSKMTESKGVLNQRVGKLTTTANFEFIFSILRTEKFENEMRLASQGAAQANISNKDVLQYMIPLPSLPEQEAIGTFFQTLDQEIAQVEDKLASLKEMKKTLLRKLFV
ncbi:restriction endonuclease subunit S [Streptococcus suis]|nr:restriction endonuclease subunit S [Streptococcus suis]